MGIFVDEYKKLLTIQYSNKEKAKKHIELILSELEKVYNLGRDFENAFDIDLALGKQLLVIGRIVGLRGFYIIDDFFTFGKSSFADKNGDNSKPIKNKFSDYDDDTLQVTSNEYRFFVRAKIVKNYTKGVMIDKDKLSMQNAIDFLFSSKGYVVDNKRMCMTIYIDRKSFYMDMVRYLSRLGLIPRPQGVRAKKVSYVPEKTFGFYKHNTGFGDKSNDKDDETYFAEKILD
jgi:hypothetical protein